MQCRWRIVVPVPERVFVSARSGYKDGIARLEHDILLQSFACSDVTVCKGCRRLCRALATQNLDGV
jgi:hypothetical protein